MKKTKLWQADDKQTLHPLVEKYTKGNDHELDQKLIGYDIQASKTHAQMLCSIGILNQHELELFDKAFDELLAKLHDGQFTLKADHEDGHTAIEQYLTEKLGDVGKKIHTGRSRNDQSLVMLRLYMKEKLEDIMNESHNVIKALNSLAREHALTPMPGYTHLQKAMPTTVGTWLDSFSEGFKDMNTLIANTKKILDQNPLGSAAGFGVSIQLDRESTTKALGFAVTQDNPMYCGLSRGLFELLAVQSLNPTMVLAGKLAQDILLFTTDEFGFFSLPSSFTTGSSIMPHKKNYDLFEIMRGQSHTFSGYIVQLQAIVSSIGSGYQRDLQLTKGVFIEAMEDAELTLKVLAVSIAEMTANVEKLQSAITKDMSSVEKINVLVYQGVPFRDAYRQVKSSLKID
jgi:argininosuccinate lyase